MKANNGKKNTDVPDDLIGTGQACLVRPLPARGQRRRSTVLRWILTGRLRGWRSGGCWLVSRAEVEASFKPVLATIPLQPEGVAAARRRDESDPEGTQAHLRKAR